jgi:beta-glucuronidase
VGLHDGASTPFNAEVTGLLERENRLVVSADARRLPTRVPMENTDWFNYGGLYRDVFLVRIPSAFIQDFFVRLVPDGTFSTIQAEVTVEGPEGGLAVFECPDLGIRQEGAVENGKASFTVQARPELWSPESPKLYPVTFSIDGDRVTDRIGFREIKTKGTEIFLNGKKIFLKGVSVHEDHVDLGKTTNEEIIRATIRDLKAMNGNYLRLAHYPHDSRFARIADEEGVLLWEEIPVYWAIAFDLPAAQNAAPLPGKHTDFSRPATYRDAENQLSELILRDRNRASVIVWSVGNENADTDARLAFMSSLVQRARELDGTRLISAACLINHETLRIEDRLAEHLDLFGINEYYGWYDPDFSKLPRLLANSRPGKPVVICEFGGGARAGQHGSADDLFTEEYQERLYQRQVATFKQCPYIAGTSPWILYDFRCPRRLNRYQEGFNRKGLIASDRVTRKLAFSVMRDYYREQSD